MKSVSKRSTKRPESPKPVQRQAASSEDNIVRVQIEMPRERVADLDALADLISARTRKEVINNALTLFELAVEESQNGRRLAFLNERGEAVVYCLPALQAVYRRRKTAVHRPLDVQTA